MRKFFEVSKSNEGETSSFQGIKYAKLDQGQKSAWDKDYRSHVNSQSVQNEKMCYNIEVVDIYDTARYKNVKAITNQTIAFINSYKNEMISNGTITKEQYHQMMGSFQNKITAFCDKLKEHERLVKHDSPAMEDTGESVFKLYSNIKERASELLDKVMVLADTQHQEQIAKMGSYQLPESS